MSLSKIGWIAESRAQDGRRRKSSATAITFVRLQSLTASTAAGIFVCRNEMVIKHKRSEQ
jgi:hypothetical protein